MVKYSSADLDSFNIYKEVKASISELLSCENISASAYWTIESCAFDYLFDASPAVIRRLREHCHHITGIRAYEYREHHAHKANKYKRKYLRLKEVDGGNLFVPESSVLGGFGHKTRFGLMNLDTLKFYESLLALDASGCFEELSDSSIIVEIGSGWGGFAYQFKTLIRGATYICVDLPETMIFSLTYLRCAFPDSRFAVGLDELQESDIRDFDFIFLTPDHFSRFRLEVDLVLNMVSFQEMTTDTVKSYCRWASDNNSRWFYSHNRDRSKHNPELTSVSDIVRHYFPKVERVKVLSYDYTQLVEPKSVSWLNRLYEKKIVDINSYQHLVFKS